MTPSRHIFLPLVVLLSLPSVYGHNGGGTLHGLRSQGVNAARDMIGIQEHINQFHGESDYHGMVSLALEYGQTFRADRIAECLFGDDLVCSNGCKSILVVAGSRVPERNNGRNHERYWLADYFGLPSDFVSQISFKPKIRNVVADLQLYIGKTTNYGCKEGAYFRLHLPIVNSQWDLNFCERVIDRGSNGQAAGYFDTRGVLPGEERDLHLLNKATEFLSGEKVQTFIDSGCSGEDFDGCDVTIQQLKCSKWKTTDCQCDSLSVTRLADVEFIAGWNFVCTEDCHFGVNFRVSAPTGNESNDEYLFEPIVGNGNHWTIGGGISTHTTCWESEDGNARMKMFMDCNISHLKRTCQTRCFDLCKQGPNSRYMLAQKLTVETNTFLRLGPAEVQPFRGNNDTDQFNNRAFNVEYLGVHKFADEYAPVANLTRSSVDVSSALQGDLAVQALYVNDDGFSFGLGYNFWARSCEKIIRRGCETTNPLNGKTWALKGDAHVFGFKHDEDTGEDHIDIPIPIAATQEWATIHAGTNRITELEDPIIDSNTGQVYINNQVDNIYRPHDSNDPGEFGIIHGLSLEDPDTTHDAGAIMASHTPVFLKESDLDMRGTKGLSHKLFGHFNYTWNNEKSWAPFVGIGGSAEFARNEAASNSPCDNNCSSCAINQWAAWIKGGFSY